MAFIFTCGTHKFINDIDEARGLPPFQCGNCRNMTAQPKKVWEWFTFCYIPIIPFSFKPDRDLVCHVCNQNQAIEQRPDVMQALDAVKHGQPVGAPQGQNTYMSPVGAQPPQPTHQQPANGYYGPPKY